MTFDLGRSVGTAAPTASLSHRDPQGRNTTFTILCADGRKGLPGAFAEPIGQVGATQVSRAGRTSVCRCHRSMPCRART